MPIAKTIQEPGQTFGDWEVMPDGEIINRRRKLVMHPDRLKEPDWWLNLRSRDWMATEWNHFIPAWFFACENAGINQIETFKINY